MILELPEIIVDSNTVVSQFRINLQPKLKKLRCKTCIHTSEVIPVDVLIQSYSVKLDKLSSVKINLIGIENISSKKFDASISYYFLKKKSKIKGSIGRNDIDKEFDSLGDLVKFIGSNFKKS